MSFGNTEDKYGGLSKTLHWLSALLIFGLVLMGFFMEGLPAGPDKFQVYGLHKSFGLIALIFVISRLLWRFTSVAPDALETQVLWEHLLAKIVQFALYLFMVGMPLSGVLMSNAGGYPVGFFGVEMPALIGKDKGIFDFMRSAHEFFAYGLLAALGLHIAGAFKHYVLDKDASMERMMFSKLPVPAPIIFIIAALFFGGVGYLFVEKNANKKHEHMNERAQEKAAPIDFSALEEHGWAIDAGKSHLEFQASMNGVSFTGRFGSFEGNIIFNPEDLPNSKASVRIDMASAVTDNKERDAQIITKDWFDIQTHPQATFDTIVIERAEGNRYIAVGNLSIRGVKLPVTLPFTLDIETGKDGMRVAKMQGALELSRLDFGIGQGEWADGKSVDTSVKVNVSLKALQPRR